MTQLKYYEIKTEQGGFVLDIYPETTVMQAAGKTTIVINTPLTTETWTITGRQAKLVTEHLTRAPGKYDGRIETNVYRGLISHGYIN